MEKTQREYYLNEQMKAIQKELGKDGEDGTDDLQELEKKLESLKLPKDVREKNCIRIQKTQTDESNVCRSYCGQKLSRLDCINSMVKKNQDLINQLITQKNILDNDHFGLEKVKERIIEYIAVQKRTKKLKGPILCFGWSTGCG